MAGRESVAAASLTTKAASIVNRVLPTAVEAQRGRRARSADLDHERGAGVARGAAREQPAAAAAVVQRPDQLDQAAAPVGPCGWP